MDGTAPPLVSPALREYYEFILELNDSCQLDLTPSEIIALVNQEDYFPENCEHSSSTQDPDEHKTLTEYSLHSVIQVGSSPGGAPCKYDVSPNNEAEKQRENSASSSPPTSQSTRSRSVLAKPELGCLVIKLTSREHLAFRHYNNAEGCIEQLNSFLSTRNVQIYLSNKKPRLTVTGNCDFGIFSGRLLKLIHLAGHWWDHRKDQNKLRSSLQLSKETKSGSMKHPISNPVDVAGDASLADKVEVAAERNSQSIHEQKPNENFIMLDSSPEELLAQQCPHLCKDFPDCDNTIPDRIVSNSCKVVYICQNSTHDLCIRADEQFDIVKRLNLRFPGVRISLLRKFPAFHVLPPEGVNPQSAINAISQYIDRFSSLLDITEELEVQGLSGSHEKKPEVDYSNDRGIPGATEAIESSTDILQQSPHHCSNEEANESLRCGPNLEYFMRPVYWDVLEGAPYAQFEPAPMLPGHLIPRSHSYWSQC